MKRHFACKAALCLAALLFLRLQFASPAFPEIVEWKGMELGLDARPKWLFKYIKGGNEKAVRNKFGVAPSSKIVLGVGRAYDLEKARAASQLDAQKRAADVSSASLAFLHEYWEEDDETGFAVYSLYECRKR